MEFSRPEYWSGYLLQGIFLTQESNPGLLHCRQILYRLSHNRSPRILEYPFSSGSSQLRNLSNWFKNLKMALCLPDVCISTLRHSVMSCSLQLHGLQLSRLLCPWTFPDWSGLPFPPPGDLPNPGIEPMSLASPTLACRFFNIASPGKPTIVWYYHFIFFFSFITTTLNAFYVAGMVTFWAYCLSHSPGFCWYFSLCLNHALNLFLIRHTSIHCCVVLRKW